MRYWVLALVFLSASAQPAAARDLFRTVISAAGQTAENGVSSILDLPDLLDADALAADFGPPYVPGSSGVGASANVRGVFARGTYAEDSSVLRFVVPAAGVDVTFDGSDRNESNQQLEDWLQGERVFTDASSSELGDLLRALIAHSPVDPVAGNPNSLESRMFEGDLGLGSLSPFLADFPDASEDIPSVVKLDLDFGYYAAGPYNGESYDIEIGIGWNLSRRFAIVTDLEMMLTRIEGDALSGFGNVGLGVVARIDDWWNFSVVARGGLVGSFDVGALAAMYSVSFVNHMRFGIGDAWLEMSNMVGVANTVSGFEIKDWDLDYDLTNVVLKNRLALQQVLPVRLGSRALRGTVYLTDTQYFVDDLWLEHTDEIGLSVGLASSSGSSVYDPATLQLAYVVGKSYDALKLSLSLRF